MSKLILFMLGLSFHIGFMLFVLHKVDWQSIVENYRRKLLKNGIEQKNTTWLQNRSSITPAETADKLTEITTIDLLVFVVSEASRLERRNKIRETWWKNCNSTKLIACWFATDRLTDKKSRAKQIQEEVKLYHDLIFLPVKPGMTFGLRFLHLIKWAKSNYNYNFILRVDDDVMLCVDHLLWDLPHFPLKNMHYGWLHCQYDENVYIDEAVSMYSADVIEKFLSQKEDEMLCHPFADQQVAIWEEALHMNKTEIIRLDNFRIHHSPPASYHEPFKQMTNICNDYIALHGVYGDDMIRFWEQRGSVVSNSRYNRLPAIQVQAACPYKPYFSWKRSLGIYRQEPKLCSDNPHWDIESFMYQGRENAPLHDN